MGSHHYAGPRHARLSGPRHAKPAPPTTAHRTVAATGVAAALALGDTMVMAGAAGSAGAVTPDSWAQLRMCESSGNYAVNTGNGYYGAYQFNLATWQGLGFTGLPSDAAPAVQDQAAQKLYAQRGWQPWPACSAKLGLVDDRQASRGDVRLPLTPPASAAPSAAPSSPAPVAAPAPMAKPPAAPPAAPTATSVPTATAAGGWDGHYITVRDVGAVRADVTAWQTQMVADGYQIAVDGRYGPKSAAAATQFEIDHHLAVERPGVVGPQIWSTLFAK
ncbi:MAG: transglycosylase family protein [Acidothermaceae bacterium]